MAVYLPNGITLALATSYGQHKDVQAITNDNPALVTANGHGFVNGEFVEVFSGWAKLNQRVVRVVNASANTFQLEEIDTTSEIVYPPGTGGGTARKINAFTQITQTIDVTMTGGDMQFVTYSFLEQDFESQIPTEASPQNIKITIGDDPNLAGYIALRNAAADRMIRALKLTFPSGATILYNGYVSFNETPTMVKNEVMTVAGGFALLSKPVRYRSSVPVIPPTPTCDEHFDKVVLLLHFDL